MGGGQSIDYMIPVSKPKQGQTAVYRCSTSVNGLIEGIGDAKTMKDIVINSGNKFKSNESLGTIIMKDGKPDRVQYISYYELLEKAKYAGSGIIHHKLAHDSEQGDMKFVAIFSRNRPQWTVIDVACMLYKLVTIPIYDTLGDQNITYVLDQTQLTTCFVNKEGIGALIKTKDLANLKTLVSFDQVDQEDRKALKQRNVQIMYFGDLMEQGKKNVKDYKSQQYAVTPNDIMTFSYTSGTTGPPKGAMLSHGNLASACGAVANNKQMNFNENEVVLSYLPLPHVLEREVVCSMLSVGAKIVYFSGNVQKINLDLALVKPTVFVSVPRLFSKFYDVIQKKFQDVPPGWTKSILQRGVQTKLENANKNGGYSHAIYDRVCFNKTRDVLGGRVRLMVSGSAPLRPQVQQFLKCVMCAPLFEGYGQTQTTGAATITASKDPQCGIIGGPVDHTEVKLVDIPDMNYTAKDKNEHGESTPRGEIWMRGPSVFKGYYKNKEKTQQAITQDGWVKSGDVGMIMPKTHALKIIDRKKNIFKLQQGEYVAPQKVEKVYISTDNFVDVFLHGDSSETFAVAIVEPHKHYMQKILKSLNIQGNYEQVCNKKEVRLAILKQMNKATKAHGIKSFEQAKNVYVEPATFQAKGIVTNTMKIQRHQARKVYSNQIKEMYVEGMLPLK